MLLLLPCAAWLLSSFFHFGDVGKWGDHYGWPKGNLITGEAPPPDMSWFDGRFWRPLGTFISKAQVTYLWHDDRIVHLIGALAHALAAYSVFALLRVAGLRRGVATIIALLFLTYPAAWEVAFWPMTTSASLGLASAMLMGVLVIRFARGQSEAIALVGLALLSFITPCLYEQPAAFCAAWPALYLACCPRGLPLRTRLFRGLVPSLVCAVGCGAYVYLMVSTTPPEWKGGASSFVPLDQLGARAQGVARDVASVMTFENFWKGALAVGWSEMESLRRGGPLRLALFAVAASFWIAWFIREHPWPRAGGTERQETTRSQVVRSLVPGVPASTAAAEPEYERELRVHWVAAFALVAFAACWLPIVVTQGEPVLFRTSYAPAAAGLVALAALVAGLLDLLRTAPRLTSFAHALLAVAMMWWVLGGSLMMTGAAAGLRARTALDMREAQRLKELVPNPPAGSVFVPLHIANPPLPMDDPKREWSVYEGAFPGVWEWHWAPLRFIQYVHARDDIASTHVHRDARGLPFVVISREGLRPREPIGANYDPPPESPPGEAFPRLVPWEKVIPFVVLADGTLKLVSEVELLQTDGQRTRIDIPLARQACEALTPEQRVAACMVWTLEERLRQSSPTSPGLPGVAGSQ
ncbi:MAG: hypothetical protein SFZ23_10385 [Planctomycetota bacterium]|nr:hypothetical protein [Planctomycetota bacterium]